MKMALTVLLGSTGEYYAGIHLPPQKFLNLLDDKEVFTVEVNEEIDDPPFTTETHTSSHPLLQKARARARELKLPPIINLDRG